MSAPYLGVSGQVILFSSLVVAGMPFLLLVAAHGYADYFGVDGSVKSYNKKKAIEFQSLFLLQYGRGKVWNFNALR